MMTKTVFKIIDITVTVAGIAVGIAQNKLAEKKMIDQIREEVTKQCSKH